jgi:hypothetical protein
VESTNGTRWSSASVLALFSTLRTGVSRLSPRFQRNKISKTIIDFEKNPSELRP